MLLCRVLLGRQLRTDAFRWEGAAQHAGSRYDSVMAEPLGGSSYREFVAFEDAQIYPEFALVYERCEQSPRAALQRCLSDTVPSYWSSQGGFFHTKVSDHHAVESIQTLMDRTWVSAFTWERRTSEGAILQKNDPNNDMPQGVRVLKVVRVEDSEMWGQYRQAKHNVRDTRARGAALLPVHVKTAQRDLLLQLRGQLSHDVNEEYLWHGSSPQVVTSILERGFPIKPGRGGTGRCEGMFGEGYYFVDCASKADEHCEDDKDGFYRGYYAMLLCRVVLGKAQILPGADLRAHERLGRGRHFDCAVGEQVASDGTFAEFVIPERSQIYPEYAVIYERMYTVPRVR